MKKTTEQSSCENPKRSQKTLLFFFLPPQELDIRQAGGRILGYQVRSICYSSTRERQPARATVVNVTGLTALLEVKGEYCGLTVAAFNSLGFGPLRTVNTEPHQRESSPPSHTQQQATQAYHGIASSIVQRI